MTRLSVGWILTLCVLCAACGDQRPASPFAGTWETSLNGHPFMILTLREESGTLVGGLSRPDHFTTSNFVQFSQLAAGVTTERVTRSEVHEGRLRITTVNPKDAADTTEYEMWRDGDQSARITLTELPDTVDAMPFVRVTGAAPAVFTAWESGCSYRLGEVQASSAEMLKLYEADQEPRQDVSKLSAVEWKEIGRKDAERRLRTKELLAAGALHTAEDFTRAAFIFQHGSTADDYLLAHTLAEIATAKGDASATWIMSATLDRYLQAIGKSQIYGTQFKSVPEGATQEPFDRALISDALRRELGVPVIAAQLVQQQEVARQSQAGAAQ